MMIHWNTKNDSALKMAYILKELGVKDYSFHLRLYDDTLANIDPLNELSITQDLKVRIHREIKQNPYYFLREILRIPTGGSIVPFEFTRGSLAIVWAIEHDISSIVILPRQCYKSMTVLAMYLWLFYWGVLNANFMLYSYGERILLENMQKIKDLREALPNYLNLYDYRSDKDNTKEMRYVLPNGANWIRYKAPNLSKVTAGNAGRGSSAQINMYDEVSFIPGIKNIYESSVFSYKTVSITARHINSHYHRIMTSSAGSLDDPDGEWVYNFIQSCCEFTEKMYDFNKEQIENVISTNSVNGFLYISFMWYDLGKPNTYLEDMKKDSVSQDAFDREVLSIWKRVSAEHPLGQDIISIISNYIDKPKDIIIVDDVYFLKLYKPIEELDFRKKYLAGLDSGGNLLKDFSALTIVDPETYEVIGVLRSNSFSTTRFAKAIAYIMLNVFNNLVLIPERNSMGIAIIDYLIDHFLMLKNRIYHDEKDKPGFFTSKESRYLLYNVLLKNVVRETYNKLHDINIINEIIGLKTTRNGRIDHDTNGHDDTLMSYLFVRWFVTYAKNRNKYINPLILGSAIQIEENEISEALKDKYRGNSTMKNYMDLLMGRTNNTLNSDGTINRTNLQNPLLAENKRFRVDRGNNTEEIINNTFNSINNRLKENSNNIDHNIQTIEHDFIDENETYNLDPNEIKKQTEKQDIKEKNLFKVSKPQQNDNNTNLKQSILNLFK
jgi:hypothetical protein